MPAKAHNEPRGWTTAEAAFILGAPLDAFKKTVDRSPVKPAVVRRGGLRVRYFAFPDLVYLHALDELGRWFTRESRQDFYWAVKRAALDKIDAVAFGPLTVNVRPHIIFVQAKTKELDRLSAEIDTRGDEALIKGTTIEAHRIAALLDGGMSVEEVLADYPTLKERQVLAAKAFAEANPKPGRPYPGRTAKAALRNADLGRLGEFLDD
ncbi:DUF433 domain-containing protein [Phenylobacterium sp.]|uniref:DUF433 domain-containing protein n=1 Tax=Phenylobacterium sp. TaxID=1871053 RepID=UPI003943CE82